MFRTQKQGGSKKINKMKRMNRLEKCIKIFSDYKFYSINQSHK